jgi:hypothetical protein
MTTNTVESTSSVTQEGLSISRMLLEKEWPFLAVPVRAAHESRPVTLAGRATVVRGWGLLSRFAAWMSGLPPEQHNGPVRVVMQQSQREGQECWTRYYGSARPMRTTLRRSRDCLDETVGITTLRFKLSLQGGSIRWTAVRGRTLGMPWPKSWLQGIDAFESHRGNHYYFNVRAALPVIGLLVHYVGELERVPHER